MGDRMRIELRKLAAVIKREYLERVRQRWFMITTAFVPLMIVAFTVFPLWLTSRSRGAADVSGIVILDASGRGLGQQIANNLFDSLHVDSTAAAEHVRLVAPGELASAESAATKQVIAQRASGYLVLDTLTATNGRARYAGRDAASFPTEALIERAVQRSVFGLRLASHGIDRTQIDSLVRVRASVAMQRLDERGRGSSGALSAGIGFGLAFLLYFAILVFGQNVMRGVMEEKQTRTAEVVVSSVKPETLLAGKVIGVAGVGLTQQVIWMGASVYLLAQLGPLLTRLSSSGTGATAGAAAGSPAPVSAVSALPIGLIALVIVFFVLGITFYCTLYAAVGAMVNSEQEAQQAALPVMLLVVTSFLFVQPITFAPNGKLARVMSVLPFSSPIVMPLRLSVIPVSAYEVALSLISTIGGCVLATWVAARIYRVGLLMYGKRPSFAEVARWVRLSNR